MTPTSPEYRLETTHARHRALDLARGFAVVLMIYMHFVGAEEGQNSLERIAAGVARWFEGKAAATFFVLAGMVIGLQAGKQPTREADRAHLRRYLALALAGILMHYTVWPTEVLLPLALTIIVTRGVVRRGRGWLVVTIVAVLVAQPLCVWKLGRYLTEDWLESGLHVADSSFGWQSVRALLFDGNYPMVPWLVFALTGSFMTRYQAARSPAQALFSSGAVFALVQIYAFWAKDPASLPGGAGYLNVSWVPTTVPFVALTGSFAITCINAFQWLESRVEVPKALQGIELMGRSSLTHYLGHLLLVFAPMRRFYPDEHWSITTGLILFTGYIVVAIPLTQLWFRKRTKGPVERLWARVG